MLGFGRYLRDVAATGNVVRKADIGIAVSVAPGAGSALIANNVIAEVLRGAIVGMDGRRIVTGDLMQGGVRALRQPEREREPGAVRLGSPPHGSRRVCSSAIADEQTLLTMRGPRPVRPHPEEQLAPPLAGSKLRLEG